MTEYAQKPQETPKDWVARLDRVLPSGLSGYLISVLGSWKRDATEKAGAAKLAAEAKPHAAAPGTPKAAAAPSGDKEALAEAKKAARALSGLDLARFTSWLAHGRPD